MPRTRQSIRPERFLSIKSVDGRNEGLETSIDRVFRQAATNANNIRSLRSVSNSQINPLTNRFLLESSITNIEEMIMLGI